MELRTVRRGLTALAIAATLGLAGAHPAAAAEHGWLEQGLRWLSGLWSTNEPQPAGKGLSIWALDSVVERGYGMDPNGSEDEPDDPDAGQ